MGIFIVYFEFIKVSLWMVLVSMMDIIGGVMSKLAMFWQGWFRVKRTDRQLIRQILSLRLLNWKITLINSLSRYRNIAYWLLFRERWVRTILLSLILGRNLRWLNVWNLYLIDNIRIFLFDFHLLIICLSNGKWLKMNFHIFAFFL